MPRQPEPEIDVDPMTRKDWIDLVWRLDLPTKRKTIALALARFAAADGTNVFPAEQKVADMAKMHVTNARPHIRALREAGLLKRVGVGGGRGGASSEYRLTRPADITGLHLWLDPHFDEYADDGADGGIHRALGLGVPAPEHRVLALGESEDCDAEHEALTLGIPGPEPEEHGAPALGESTGIPSATARSSPVDNEKHRAFQPETPSVSPLNTERQRSTKPIEPRRTTPWSPQATNSRSAAADPNTIKGDDGDDADYETAHGILADLPPPERDHWRRKARTELEADGSALTRRAVDIRAADLATRPTPAPAPDPVTAELDAWYATTRAHPTTP